jgi:hypothetical protein
MIDIVDAVEGVVKRDLGDLIDEYNQLNIQHPCSLRKVQSDQSVVICHHIAGYLGVYGNIATSTFLHGAVVLQLCNNLDETNVAGDDGIVPTEDDDDVFPLIRHLGLMAEEKAFVSHQGGCIHLKRPLVQVRNRLYQGSLVIWPSFEYLATTDDELDPRYPLIKSMTLKERRDAFANSVTTFLTSLTSYSDISELMKDIVDVAITRSYHRLGLPLQGFVPQVLQGAFGFVAAYDRLYIGVEPKRNTILRNYAGIVKLSLRGRKGYEPQCVCEQGEEFQCNSSKGLNYAETLGYLEKTRIDSLFTGEVGLEMLLKEYFDPDPPLYIYKVLKSPPRWLEELF